MARRPRHSVAPLRRSSAGWMPARIGRLSTGVGRKHLLSSRCILNMKRLVTLKDKLQMQGRLQMQVKKAT